MGHNKEPAKKVIVPTRRGTNLPSRPHLSPNVDTTPAINKKYIARTSSPLSRMSTTVENYLLEFYKDN